VTRHRSIIALALAFGVLSLVAAAQQGTPTGKAPAAKGGAGAAAARNLKNPVPATPESVQAGRRVFAQQCSSCHGFTGKGDGPKPPEGSKPSDLTDANWDHGPTDGEIFVAIRDGIGPKFDMPLWKDKLSDQDIWNAVNFVRTLKK
jgi:mono/diheme cytochrome c family protein